MFGSPQQAKHVAKQLVKERLVGCAQVVPRVTSFYWWEDRVQSAKEYMLLVKTTQRQQESTMERLRTLHDYSCPEILAWELSAADDDYANWLRGELNDQS